MQVIDSQLHDFGPRLKWAGIDEATRHDLMTELMLAWMDAVGVDGAIVNPGDPPWLMRAMGQVPQRLAGVFHLKTAEAPNVEDEVARMRDLPGVLGHRHSFGKLPTDMSGQRGRDKFNAGAYDGLFKACQKYDRPLFCSAYGSSDLVGRAAKAYPKLRIIADHMGISQPPLNPRTANPWSELDDLLALAPLPNVYVKLCGAPVLSDQPYPYDDIWPNIHRILKAFGTGRVMWASDVGRFQGRIGWGNEFEVAHEPYTGKHNYADSLYFILHTTQVSASEKEQLLGGTVRKLTGWAPGAC